MKRFNLLSAILSVVLVISTCILPTTAVIAQAATQNATYYYGDLNGNGDIDKFDYLFIKRYCVGNVTLSAEQLLRGDVNKSGTIDKFDYILVKRHVMGTYNIPSTEEACDHNYIPVVTPPTETEKGFTTHTCDKCGDSYVDSYVDPVTPPKKGLSYSVNLDGKTCTITGIGDHSNTELTIPSEIDGYTVTGIGEVAFFDCIIIVIVIIPATVT